MSLDELERINESNEYMVLSFLNKGPKNFMRFVIPKNVKKYFYKDGKIFKGFKPYWRALLFLLITSILFSMLDFKVKYVQEENYDGQTYFIDNAEKLACWNTFKASFFYNPDYPGGQPFVYPESKEFQSAAAYMKKAFAADSDQISFRLNNLIIYHNLAVIEYKEHRFKNALDVFLKNEELIQDLQGRLAVEKEKNNVNYDSAAEFMNAFNNEQNYMLGLSYLHNGNRQKARICSDKINYDQLGKFGLKQELGL